MPSSVVLKIQPAKFLPEFLQMLDKILTADNSYDDMRTLFVEHCVKNNDVFNCMYRLILPENNDVVNQIERITNCISDLRKQEAE